MVTTQRRAALDDGDSDLYDPKYYPRKVVRDGGRVRVPIFLTDWAPPTRPVLVDYARDAYRNYQPHFYVGDSDPPALAAERSYLERSAHLRDARRTGRGTGDAEIRDAREAAEQAYDERKKWLADAYRTMGGGTGGAAHTTAPAAEEPDGESARDAWIRRLGNAWKTPPGQDDPDDDADAIERQREAWAKPGAKPGVGDASAALADAEKAREASRAAYLDSITNAWRRP